MIWDSCFLLLNSPRGGVEDLDYLVAKAPWVRGLFLNVRDYPVGSWISILERARARNLAVGPWGRTTDPTTDKWDPDVLDELIRVADLWRSPLLVNSEAELKGSGAALTSYINAKLGERDAAISMEPWPFANVDWTPLAGRPVLPQIFGAEWARDAGLAKAEWHRVGIKRVYYTFGTFGSSSPATYTLQAPYSLFTGDPLMATYSVEAWKPTSIGYDPTDGRTAPKPPSAAELAPAYREAMVELARTWEGLEPGDSPGARITVARRVLETTDQEWYAVRGSMRALLDGAGVGRDV